MSSHNVPLPANCRLGAFLLLVSLLTTTAPASAVELVASRSPEQAKRAPDRVADPASIYHDGWIDFNKSGERDPYEDPSLTNDERAEDLLGRMTIDEKTCQLATLYGYQRVLADDLPTEEWRNEVWKDGIANIDEHINGVAGFEGKPESAHTWPPSAHARAIDQVQRWFIEQTRLGVPVDFTNEGLRGVCYARGTNFPAAIGVGATWDRTLVREIGRVTGAEAHALGYTHIYSPILDLARDPRWGRVVECYGEDPYLVAALGVEQVRGLKRGGVGCSPKHFAAYSVPQGGRDGDARTAPAITPSELETIYLYAFRRVIQGEGVSGVMSSYNDYDGVPVSGDPRMLTDVLRKDWGFRGYVVSDSDAVKFLAAKHHVAGSERDAVRMFVAAGGNVRTEFNSPRNFIDPLRSLVASGELPEEVLDDRVRDVLRTKFALGLFDTPYSDDPDSADDLIHCERHEAVSLRAARESIVLLKNEGGVLPLDKRAGRILVCGPNAATTKHSRSRYGPMAGEVASVLDGVRHAVGSSSEVVHVEGCPLVDAHWPESEILREEPDAETAAMIAEAVDEAQRSDVVIAVVGGGERTVGESKSRTSLDLPGHQEALVRALQATGKPVVVVLINGRPLTINWIDRHVPAIVEAWFPGEHGGDAVADVLFGDYNPGGKLPVTFPKTVGQLPFCFPYKLASHAGQGAGQPPTRVEGSLYPFGHGLSYTQFAYTDLELGRTALPVGESLDIRLTVRNTGPVAGDEVVQLYLRDEQASRVPYEKMLRGFERVSLRPGQSKPVHFRLTAEDMECFGVTGGWSVELGRFTVQVGSSSTDIRLEEAFEVLADRGEPSQTPLSR